MDQIFDFLFSQYSSYSPSFIYLELFAVIMNITSVVYAKRNNILVYPTGLIGTGIFVYILLNFSLLGDTIINAYFFSMSIYGWYFWSRKKDKVFINQVSTINRNEIKYLFILAISSLIFIYFVYDYFDKWNNWTAYVDNITTAIFFVAMWLMARRKIESWIFWIIGDLITVPLYFYKGLTISSIQYIIFLILAVLGYISWKKNLRQESSEVKRVVICGPESTGKSTLTQNLASHYNTSFANEFARDFLQDKWDISNTVCTKKDLIDIVKGQIDNENKALLKADKLLFCDTNILTTIAWSKTHFNGYCNEWIIDQSKKLSYDYYLILNVDTEWIQDDLRDRPNEREKMFDAHKLELDLLGVSYNIIVGSDYKKRFEDSIDFISKKFLI